MEIKSLCFTGPRPKQLLGYSEASRPAYDELQRYLTAILEQFAQLGCRKFISGGAQGFDQLAYKAVEALQRTRPDCENWLYVPFEHQDSQWAERGIFSKAEYRSIREKAEHFTRMCSDLPRDTPFGQIAGALHHRNHCMVADSDCVIALLCGRSLDYRNSAGGTAECVRYALSKNVPVFAIEYRPELPTTAGRYTPHWLV